VEGGCWLLVGSDLGAVQYYDLNAVNISATALIPPPFDGRAEVWISVDMDSIAESLKFNLGILTCRRPNTNDPAYPHSPCYAWWIQVWQVTMEVDSLGRVKGLTSELQSSFREEYEPICFSFRLRGQYIAYSLFYSDLQVGPMNHGHRVIVVDWTTHNSTSLNYTRKSITTNCYATRTSISSFMILPMLQPPHSPPSTINTTLRLLLCLFMPVQSHSLTSFPTPHG